MSEIKIENFKPSAGEVDEEQFFGKDEFGKREQEKALRETKAIKAKMSPPGVLNLPPLLEARRLEFGITDGAFREQAAFERILIHQLPLAHELGSRVGSGVLYRPEDSESAAKRSSCRGIIVSAGLRALDDIRTNGMDLGHIIQFIHLVPFSIPVDYLDNGELRSLLNLNAGDILASEDLALQLRTGEMELFFQEFGENSHHIFWPKARAGEVHQAPLPTNPFKSQDY